MALFETKAPPIMAGLMRDLGVQDFQAGGVLGNIGWECAGFEHLSQIGGSARGWVQWDGVRKAAFLTWCANNHLDWMSDEANYRYLILELKGSERAALNALLRTKSLHEASDVFEEKFERAGKPALSVRRGYADRAMAAYAASDKKPITFGTPPLPPPPDIPRPIPPPPPPAFGGFFAALIAFFRALFARA